ncbi:hypothetical protein QJS04_geneDACA001839 [Acorus gramineus]|uniref:Poly A polymerase head domain-containing protein n=1 Tax=Acorus gramineus TaxID=55184 RepID=A0AAV9BGR3_ACOGR|nr:hypothetical protein QJS04_geneDACA001839 [Acorus gramineus]
MLSFALKSARVFLTPRKAAPPIRKNLAFLKPYLRRLHWTSTMCSSASPPSPLVAVKEKIELTEAEEKIFRRLLDVVRHFKLPTQLRVAGGWVRDKLLGKESKDIDIALDDMLGREFCEKINQYLDFMGEETRDIGVIQCNPDQSKHLETATMPVFDMRIDFVNLRSETYAENSRIPTMKFGTAEEDAYRRDLTINSLFYNINNNSIEDLTGRGIQDLKSGIIETPLPPKSTFLDDPLRVLRAIRFGARFDFSLDEELQKAAADEEVKAAIGFKISRERIGHEVNLMISGNRPIKAVTYICDLQLFWVVFSLPQNHDVALSERCDRLSVAYMDAAWKSLQLIGYSIFNDEQRRLYLYASLFFPLKNKETYSTKKSKKVPLSSYVILNSLKLKVSDAETVLRLHNAAERFTSLITFLASDENSKIVDLELEGENFDVSHSSRKRILTGLLLHQIKDYWRVALLLSTLLYPNIDSAEDFMDREFDLEKSREIYFSVMNAINKMGLKDVWKLKPLLNGNDIMKILQLKNGGPQIREWQQKVLKWQLAHPDGTAEECEEWIMQTLAKRVKLSD